jgi:hypothetical protein
MVHQYNLDTPQTSLENAYQGFKENITDPNMRTHIINKALGKENPQPNPTKQDYIDLFNPNADFVNTYNQRSIKEASKKEKEEQYKLVNEQGQQYELLWKQEGFRQIHDPLSRLYLI